MFTPQTARARKASDMPGDVGLGPFVGGAGRAVRVEHGGVNEGFVSNLVLYPALGVGAVVMANGDGAHLLLKELELALAAEYGWPGVAPRKVVVMALDSARAAGVAGRYTLRAGPGVPAEVRQVGSRLYLGAPQLPPDEELLPVADARGETRFVTSTLGWGVAFTRDASGRATRLAVTRGGRPAVIGERAQ
jgi:hypothetical protein